MTKEELIELINSWENIDFFIKEIPVFPERINLLMEIILSEEYKHSWRAAYIMDKIYDESPELIHPFIDAFITNLPSLKNLSKKRHFLKLISQNQIPEEHMGFLLDFCINTLSSTEPPAVRVHAMQILYNISEILPDFKVELYSVIEHEIEYHNTPGISSRGKKLLLKLKKQIP